MAAMMMGEVPSLESRVVAETGALVNLKKAPYKHTGKRTRLKILPIKRVD